MIKKVIIPIAGRGTRLLPVTKEQSKSMLPVFSSGPNGELCVKPLLQMIFEQLFIAGLREFCFVVGRDQQTIKDHFTVDSPFVADLEEKGKTESAGNLRLFYKMVHESSLHWIDQLNPNGFGDAVLKAESFANRDDFLVHAGDTLIMTDNAWHLTKCLQRMEDDDAIMVVRRVTDPERFGVIRSRMSRGKHAVMEVIEKPKRFISNTAIMPVYSFGPSIFGALRSVEPGVGGEIQLTDGIEKVIQHGKKVSALELPMDSIWIDVGTPESYWKALEETYNMSVGRPNLLAPAINGGMIEQKRLV